MAREKEYVIPKQMYQVRVAPVLRWPYNKHPIFYDSKIVFYQESLATKYIPYYIRGLKEDGVLKKNTKIDAWVVTLTVYVHEDIQGGLHE
jgi:hypothetical protein